MGSGLTYLDNKQLIFLSLSVLQPATMASNLKAKFEDLARPRDPTMEEVEVGTGKWKHSGNSGGGHTGHDGTFGYRLASLFYFNILVQVNSSRR